MATAKLLAPAAPPTVIARPALLARLDDAFSRRLTTVVAGAGFGKSTLLAAWAREVACSWYTVDAADDDLTTFARGLLASLRRRVPELSTDLDAAVTAALGPNAAGRARAEAVAAGLADALHTRPGGPLLIVLEDLHELAAEAGAVRLVEALCRQTPTDVHIAVTSRAPMPFGIQRWRGRGEVLELDSTELAFTRDETAQVIRLLLDGEDPQLAEALHQLTGGWPAAVRLACEALRHRPPAERAAALAALTDRAGPLMGYLLEEVLSAEPEPVRALLGQMRALGLVSPELCRHLGVAGAEEKLSDLQRRGLLIARTAGAESWFELNALVREGLAAAVPADSAEPEDVAEQAAEWFVARGDAAAALRCLMLSGSDDAVAGLLADRGADLVAAGEVRLVASAAERLPSRLLTPSIALVEGEARQVLGDWDRALDRFRTAGGDQESLPPGLAWRMGLIHYLRGDVAAAREVYERGQRDPASPRDTALLLAWTASAHWLSAQVQPARSLADEALQTAAECGDDDALAASHTVLAMLASHDGDRRANARHYQLAQEAAERTGNVLQRIRIHTNHGSHALEEGDYDEAEEHLNVAIRLAELTGYAVLHGLALANRGDARLGVARLEEATADFRAASTILETVDSSLVVYPLRGLGDAYALRGELMLARAAFEDAAALAERAGDHQALSAALAGLARVIAADDVAGAQAFAERALAVSLGVQLPGALLALGWVALVAGEARKARDHAVQAAAEARARWDRAALAQSLELRAAAEPEAAAAHLQQAMAMWEELGNRVGAARVELALARLRSTPDDRMRAEAALRRLRDLGVRSGTGSAPAPPDQEPAGRAELAVRSLGGFRIARTGEAIPQTAWQSKKARDLLKVLVARRGRPVPREQLMDVLWPGVDPGRLGNRLSVALSTLRAVLDPDRSFPADHFVTADRATVSLVSEHVDVDVERFLAAAGAGLAQRGQDPIAAQRLLTAAEAAYGGDFLEEDQYEEWAAPPREEARAAYLAVTRALAEDADAAGEHDRAIRAWLRVLERDPYDEQAHLALVTGVARAGRHGEAQRYYQEYIARMRELGVEALAYPG